jgi:hypothetical protein
MKTMVVTTTTSSFQREGVVDLTKRRLHQLEQAITDTRTHIESLELIRFRTEIKTGELKRKLARHIHDLKVLQDRLAELYGSER